MKDPTFEQAAEMARAFISDQGLARICRMSDDELFDYMQRETDGPNDVEPPTTYDQLLFHVAKFRSRQRLREIGLID